MSDTLVPKPRALVACARAAFGTLLIIALPGCLLTTLAYFISTPALFAQLSPFRLQYAVLLGSLSLLALALRHLRWALLFFGFSAFNLWAVLQPALRPMPPAAGEVPRPSLRILLANVLTSNPDPAPLLALIAAEKPDLVALLEIDQRWQKQLAPVLPAYPHSTFYPRDDNFGIALLSRIPPSDIRREFFADTEVPSLALTLPLDRRPVRILLTHPLPPGSAASTELRNRQLSELIDWAAAARQGPAGAPGSPSGSVLILGDLNSTPWCPPLRRLLASAGLRPAWRGHSWGAATWPAPVPFFWIPLDHALLDPSLACTSYRTGPDIGSDHFPVLVELSHSR